MTEPSDVASSPKKSSCCRCRNVTAAVVVLAAVFAGMVLYARRDGSRGKESLRESKAGISLSRSKSDPDARMRRLVVGTWTDNYQGKRTMSLIEDGTGTMVVELSGWRAMLSAARLRFEMLWSVESGHLKKRTVGGEPRVQVQMILKTMGDRVDEPILELSEDRLLLVDQDGKTRYDWRRVKK